MKSNSPKAKPHDKGNCPAAPFNPAKSFGISIRTDVLRQIDLMKAEYEAMKNEELLSCDDGLPHKRFSCRDNSTEMTIPNCVRFMLTMNSGDIFHELVFSTMFDEENVPSASTYCQVRDKIPMASFERLFYWFANKYYWKVHYDLMGIRMLAVDGTEDSYPHNPNEPDNCVRTRSETKARNLIHANVCFDPVLHFVVDVIPQDAHAKDERQALYAFMQRIAKRYPNPDQRILNLFTSDRGYEAWNLPVLAESLGVSYLCRIKSEESNGILSGIKHLLPVERNSFDRVITITLTRDPSKKGRPGYHYLQPGTYCELVTHGHDYTVEIRIVKIRISDTVTEYLFTNLRKSAYSKAGLMHLYHKRWNVETAIGFVKYPLAMAAPHAASSVPITKEMWCRFLMYNICSVIAYQDDYLEKKEATGKKYDYSRDFSSAIDVIVVFMRGDKIYDIDSKVQKLTRPIRIIEEPRERNKTGGRKNLPFNHRMG